MKPKKPNLAPDGLDIRQAAELLGITEKAVGYAVGQRRLRCGIMARGWRGHCKPVLPISGARWEGASDDKSYSGIERNSGAKLEVRVIRASQFWYLRHTSAYELFAISTIGTAPTPFLEPYDGEGSHREDPGAFPSVDCVFWPHDRDKDSISITDVLFLRQDIEQYREKYLSPAAINKDAPDYLNKSHPCYSPKLAMAIECWIALFGDDGTARHNAGYKDQIEEWKTNNASNMPREFASFVQPQSRGNQKQVVKMKDWKGRK